jgi:hypothetical protein
MPRLSPFRLAAACALALVVSLVPIAAVAAKGVPAELRVVGKAGKVLGEGTFSTGTVSVKTSKSATCFGAGTGGSGRSVSIKGATAMGLLVTAARTTPTLRPLSITDAFSFGLGLCGIGNSAVSGKKASWYLKVNHKAQQVGGDAVKLHPGDEVLWDLASSYPYPNELALEAPETVEANVAFQVRVVSYDEKGKRKPVAGATVTGAGGPTDSQGHATVTLAAPSLLRATHGKEIPSAAEPVCIAGSCPSSSR